MRFMVGQVLLTSWIRSLLLLPKSWLPLRLIGQQVQSEHQGLVRLLPIQDGKQQTISIEIEMGHVITFTSFTESFVTQWAHPSIHPSAKIDPCFPIIHPSVPTPTFSSCTIFFSSVSAISFLSFVRYSEGKRSEGEKAEIKFIETPLLYQTPPAHFFPCFKSTLSQPFEPSEK